MTTSSIVTWRGVQAIKEAQAIQVAKDKENRLLAHQLQVSILWFLAMSLHMQMF